VSNLSHEQRMALGERESSELPITQQAELLSVSRSSLYYHPREPSAEEIAIKHRIDELYTQSPFYGSRKSKAQLRREGVVISRKTVQRHLREMGIVAIYPGPNLSRRQHKEHVFPYLA
jgi:putative transposase